MRTFKDAEVRLAETLPGYESRPPQQALAAAVEGAIFNRTHLLGEAGCGTGKSLGYLIPAILSGKRVVISTATKALQDQVANEDVPFLQEHLGKPFSFALLKGRRNYLCLNKAEAVDPADVPNIGRLLADLTALAADPGFVGDRESLPFEVSDAEWRHLAADSDDCQALECKDKGICFAVRARKAAKEAQVVVVNHALYLTDLVVREMTGGAASMLDQHDVVVFDEAHEVEKYASSTLGSQFKTGGVAHLVSEVRNFGRRHVPTKAAELEVAGNEVLTAMTTLFMGLERAFIDGKSDKLRIRPALLLDHGDNFVGFANALDALHEAVADGGLLGDVPGANYNDVKKKRDRISGRTLSTAGRFKQVILADFNDLVRWVERDSRGNLTLATAPVTVAPYLREALFGAGNTTAVLVSATLSVDGKFDYVAGRLGIDTYTDIDVGTPFDFTKQALFYVPTDIGDPSPANRAAWSSMMASRTLDLVRASKGRALLLFTSNRELNAAYNAIADRIPYNVYKQGDAPNRVLMEQFKEDTDSVLFATASFFTGVDFQGDTCSLVVIDKLPFPVPTDPIVEARCDAIKRAGGNDFSSYTIPEMTLPLKQGFGRLIRHRNDKGVFALMDARVVTKGYGTKIVRSLPDAPRTDSMADVLSFFAEGEG